MFKFCTASSALALFVLAAPAFADCTPLVPDDGETLTCTGTDIDGINQGLIDNGNLDEITVNVTAGAMLDNIASSDVTVELDDDAVINVAAGGAIRATAGDHAIKLDKRGFVGNAGLISGGKDGINLGDRGRVENTGTILAGDDGVQADDGLSFSNAGLLSAQDEGINAGNGATVVNGLGAVMQAHDDAVKVGVNAVVRNFGVIENIGTDLSDPQDGIDIDQGVIENHGVIKSTLDAAIDYDAGAFADSLISNTGTITGSYAVLTDPGNLSGQVVTSSGSMTGTIGTAMQLGLGQDRVSLLAGSNTIGDIDMGGDADLLQFSSALSFSGAVLMGAGDDLVSFDTMALFDADWYADNSKGVFGGLGVDTLSFAASAAEFDALVSISWLSGNSFVFDFAGAETAITFTDFEYLTLAGETYAMSDYLPAVPLPAGIWLMLSGLGGLAAFKRRKA